jgi:uncharacterized membrane-anchored protein
MGDVLAQSNLDVGLDYGRVRISILFLSIMVSPFIYLSFKQKQSVRPLID